MSCTFWNLRRRKAEKAKTAAKQAEAAKLIERAEEPGKAKETAKKGGGRRGKQ